MDTVISFTPAELVAFIGAIAAVCAGIATIVGFICKVVAKWRAPEVEQNKRIKACEDRLDKLEANDKKYSQFFANDDERFTAIENSNRVTQGAILALLKHALNEGDKSALVDAEKQLEKYLLEK